MTIQSRFFAQDVLNLQDYFRLYQTIDPGDIFRIDGSCQSLAIGPDSDIAKVRVVYYDPQFAEVSGAAINTFANELTVSVGNPWVGRLDARMNRIYPKVPASLAQGNRARLLVYPDDILRNNYVPDVAGVVVERYQPFIDLQAYFGEPPSLAPIRSDRVFDLSTANSDGSAPLAVFFPYYGRRKAMFHFESDGDINMSLHGVRYTWGEETAPQKVYDKLLAGFYVLSGDSQDLIVRSTQDGYFDELYVLFETGDTLQNALLSVTISDTEG